MRIVQLPMHRSRRLREQADFWADARADAAADSPAYSPADSPADARADARPDAPADALLGFEYVVVSQKFEVQGEKGLYLGFKKNEPPLWEDIRRRHFCVRGVSGELRHLPRRMRHPASCFCSLLFVSVEPPPLVHFFFFFIWQR